MKTEKKKGRGRPKKVTLPLTSVTTTNTKEYYDIVTNEIIKQEPSLPKDFSVTIDNATFDGEVRIELEGNSELRQTFLANAYLDNPKFREFFNDVIVRAARAKAHRISVELNSIVN